MHDGVLIVALLVALANVETYFVHKPTISVIYVCLILFFVSVWEDVEGKKDGVFKDMDFKLGNIYFAFPIPVNLGAPQGAADKINKTSWVS